MGVALGRVARLLFSFGVVQLLGDACKYFLNQSIKYIDALALLGAGQFEQSIDRLSVVFGSLIRDLLIINLVSLVSDDSQDYIFGPFRLELLHPVLHHLK